MKKQPTSLRGNIVASREQNYLHKKGHKILQPKRRRKVKVNPKYRDQNGNFA